ncbi:hypothetical protein M3J07_001932 [Ascochyta lentis]
MTVSMLSTMQDSPRNSLSQDTIDTIKLSLSLSVEINLNALPQGSGAGSPLVGSPSAQCSPMEEGNGKEYENPNNTTQDAHNEPHEAPPPVDDWTITPAELERLHLERAHEAQVSSIPYLTISPHDEEEAHNVTTTREQVRHSLRYFRHIQFHLRASTKILNTYSPKDFLEPHLVPDTTTPIPDEASEPEPASETSRIAKDQVLFTYHHNAVSETLQQVERDLACETFGLPSNYAFRGARNTFCHSVLVPGGGIWWAQAVEGAKEEHARLLRQVQGTVLLLEGRLADGEVWGERGGEEEEEEDEVVHWHPPGTAEALADYGGNDEQTSQDALVLLEGGGEVSADGGMDMDLCEPRLAQGCERPGMERQGWSGTHDLSSEDKSVDVRDFEFVFDEDYERLHG